MLLFLIAAAWAAWLVPIWVRKRRESHPTGSVDSFSVHLYSLSALDRSSRAAKAETSGVLIDPSRPFRTPVKMALQPAGGRGPIFDPGLPVVDRLTMTRSQARRRRRDVLLTLSVAALVTLLPAVLIGGPALWLQLLIDVALVGYVGLLLRAQKLAVERAAKVRFMSPRVAEPQLLLRRSATG